MSLKNEGFTFGVNGTHPFCSRSESDKFDIQWIQWLENVNPVCHHETIEVSGRAT